MNTRTFIYVCSIIIFTVIHTTTYAATTVPSTVRKADIRKQARLEKNNQTQVHKTMQNAVVNKQKPTTRTSTASIKDARAQTRLTANLLKKNITSSPNQTTDSIIQTINSLRVQNKAKPLQLDPTLSLIAQKQLQNDTQAFNQATLKKAIADTGFTFKTNSKEDCNCAGSSDSYRQIVLSKRNIDSMVESLISTYKDAWESGAFELIGISENSQSVNIIIAGTVALPVTLFTNDQITQFKSEIFTLTNKERTNNGLPALTTNPDLAKTAQNYAERMWNEKFYEHISPDGGTLEDRIGLTNYFNKDLQGCNCRGVEFAIGENIAKGQKDAAQVMNDWMNSPGHRANILSSHFTEIGIGVYGNRWVQNFGATTYK